MGSQTGVSLYAPSTGASLVTLRGTDGIASGAGVMPLTWLQDFAGPMARTTSDVARILNATTGTDPDDIFTIHNDAGAKRPADYKAALDPNALQGKKIGYFESSFTGSLSYGQDDGTPQALKARFADIEAAGATMVPITASTPASAGTGTLTGNRTEEGWQRYFELHEDPPYDTAAEILGSPLVLPYNRGTRNPAPRLTARGRRQDPRLARREQAALGGVHGLRKASTRSSTRASAPTSTTTTAPRRSPPIAAAACRRPTSACRRWCCRSAPTRTATRCRCSSSAARSRTRRCSASATRSSSSSAAPATSRPTTAPKLAYVTEATAPVGGMVPATLALTLGAPASFGAFTPGVAREYTASTTAERGLHRR